MRCAASRQEFLGNGGKKNNRNDLLHVHKVKRKSILYELEYWQVPKYTLMILFEMCQNYIVQHLLVIGLWPLLIDYYARLPVHVWFQVMKGFIIASITNQLVWQRMLLVLSQIMLSITILEILNVHLAILHVWHCWPICINKCSRRTYVAHVQV